MKKYIFGVITKVPIEKDGVMPMGNLYNEIGYDENGKMMPISFLVENFCVGELLIYEKPENESDGTYEREVNGNKRKPCKWDVEQRIFETFEEAVAFAITL